MYRRYKLHNVRHVALLVALALPLALSGAEDKEKEEEKGFVPLFPKDGVPGGWLVRPWNDLSKSATPSDNWKVRDGILHGSSPRGTWLVSKREYGDFVLKYEFKLGPLGNSGCALRAPLFGDPAFDGMEMQMADLRYNTAAKESELTGGIYRAIAPRKQAYKPTEWNSCEITLKGSRLRIVLNGELIHDLDLDEQAQEVKRHDGSLAPPVKARPRRGHIGFQELSRGGDRVQIRKARIKVLDRPAAAAKKGGRGQAKGDRSRGERGE
jgi:hypothetical protein